MTNTPAEKIDRASFAAAFNEAAIDPNQDYKFVLEVSEPGYVPKGIAVRNSTDEGRLLLCKAQGSVIEELARDDKVVTVSAPPKTRLY